MKKPEEDTVGIRKKRLARKPQLFALARTIHSMSRDKEGVGGGNVAANTLVQERYEKAQTGDTTAMIDLPEGGVVAGKNWQIFSDSGQPLPHLVSLPN